ncbi:8082_t:CDS:1, partial [Racocetra persica]
DHEFVEMINTYLARIDLHEKEIRRQVNDSEIESNKENIFSNVNLRNPRKVATKGRPKLSSHRNNKQ